MNVWYVDLLDSSPVVSKYDPRYLEADLADAETSDPKQLEDWDWRIFLSENAAHEFLGAYVHALRDLPRQPEGPRPTRRYMPYKRRYLILTLMGLKTFTDRSYDKGWKRGDLFYLNDQTHFLLARVKRIEALGDGEFRYHFDLPGDIR